VASLSWAGKTKLRVEEIAPTPDAASASADAVRNLLNFVRNVENVSSTDAAHAAVQTDIKSMLDSAEISQHKDKTIFTANIPSGLLQKLVSAPMDLETAPAPKKSQQHP
jgi:hypothetical protein